MLMPRMASEWHTDAAKYNEKKHFDLVAGVFLSPVKGRCEGNLWVRMSGELRRRKTSVWQTASQPHSGCIRATRSLEASESSVRKAARFGFEIRL